MGYDGLGGHINEDYFTSRPSLYKAGLKMPEIYWGCFLDPAGNLCYKEGLNEKI